jgi:hypothetical protein
MLLRYLIGQDMTVLWQLAQLVWIQLCPLRESGSMKFNSFIARQLKEPSNCNSEEILLDQFLILPPPPNWNPIWKNSTRTYAAVILEHTYFRIGDVKVSNPSNFICDDVDITIEFLTEFGNLPLLITNSSQLSFSSLSVTTVQHGWISLKFSTLSYQ